MRNVVRPLAGAPQEPVARTPARPQPSAAVWLLAVIALIVAAGALRATMLVTVFVFLGIEGASVYSRYAKERSDVGKATIFGFIGVTALMVLVTLLPYAVLARAEIADMRQPSMAAVLEAVVGPWGAVFVSIGLVVSVLGAYLAWSLIAAEVRKANESLARVEQVKAFRILPKALDPEEEGEPVTPTRKVKRSRMVERFADLVESMYDDREARLVQEGLGKI